LGIIFKKEGNLAVFTINRPEAMNSLHIPSLGELSGALLDFDNDPRLRCGIITGSGEKAFCSGIDIRKVFDAEIENGRQSKIPPTLMRGLEIKKPLIAAINGAALGGGLELALACDIRIAAQNTVFGFPEVGLGIIPGWGGTQRLIRQIPFCLAAELLLTGKSIDAAEAWRNGLINAVVPFGKLLEVSYNMAETISAAAPLAVQAAKEAMLKGSDLNLTEGFELEDALQTYLKTSADFREGIRAFKEKRKPDFKGE